MKIAFRALPYAYLLLALLPVLSVSIVLWRFFSALRTHDVDEMIDSPLSLVPLFLFIGIGATFFLVSITNAVLLFRRRKWKLSLVLSAVTCLGVPFGTIIGAVSLFILTRKEIKDSYALRG